MQQQNIPKHEQNPPAQKKPDQQIYAPKRVAPPASQESNNPISKQSSATAEITAILQKLKSLKKSEIISQIPSQIAEICKKNESEASSIMGEFSKSLCAKAVKDAEFATLAAQLCNALWIMENTCKYLRSPLLSTVQDQYKKRGELNQELFYGLTVFLCELYNVLRVQGKPLKPLNKPVCELLKQLIASKELNDDDAFYFFQEMERVGEVIEQDNKVIMFKFILIVFIIKLPLNIKNFIVFEDLPLCFGEYKHVNGPNYIHQINELFLEYILNVIDNQSSQRDQYDHAYCASKKVPVARNTCQIIYF